MKAPRLVIMETKNAKSLGCIRKTSLRRLDLDHQTLCEGFEEVHGKFYTHETLPEKEMVDYAWRVILGDDYEEARKLRDEIMGTFSDEYESSVENNEFEKEGRRRFLKQKGLI
jgi:triphosphoribosyl-dephospho-CoA synthetase